MIYHVSTIKTPLTKFYPIMIKMWLTLELRRDWKAMRFCQVVVEKRVDIDRKLKKGQNIYIICEWKFRVLLDQWGLLVSVFFFIKTIMDIDISWEINKYKILIILTINSKQIDFWFEVSKFFRLSNLP